MDSADLEGAKLYEAHFKNSILANAVLQNADLSFANLKGAHLVDVVLTGADLRWAKLSATDIWDSRLRGACFKEADLRGADLHGSSLEGADFTFAVVDGATLLSGCKCDRHTDFTGVGLRNARIPAELRSTLEGNIRRFVWYKWYSKSRLNRYLGWPVRLFWSLSDYGRSTWRLIVSFFGFALIFALIYHLVPGIVTDTGCGTELPSALAFLRSCYFSIVTMTTLGFGDIHATHGSAAGYLLVTVHVILGYVLLGALVTRLAILFQEA